MPTVRARCARAVPHACYRTADYGRNKYDYAKKGAVKLRRVEAEPQLWEDPFVRGCGAPRLPCAEACR